jgi:excisionase family DNA binding protein
MMNPSMNREVYTTGQVAVLFGVSPKTATKWIDSGALPGYRVPSSRFRRVRRRDLEVFMAKHGVGDKIVLLSLDVAV